MALALIEGAGMALSEAGALTETDTGCRLTGVAFNDGTYLHFRVGRVDWAVDGLAALRAGDGSAVLAADIAVTDARFFPQPPDDWFAWMMEVQNRRNLIGGRLRARMDVAAEVIEIEEFSVDFPGRNGVSLATRAEGGLGFGMTSGGFDAMRLRRFELQVENEGYLDGMYLGILTERLRRRGDDPKAVEAALKAEIQGLVRALPDAVFPGPTRDALLRLVADGPAPWGRLTLSLEAGEGLSLNRFLDAELAADPFSPQALAAAMAGTTVTIGYEPWGARE